MSGSAPHRAAVAAILLACTASAQVTVKTLTLRGADPDGRRAYFGQSIRFWGTGQYPDDPAFLARLVTLSNGRTMVGLWCPGKTDAKTGAWQAPLGMCAPSKANWYTNDFLDVQVNGQGLRDCPAELVEACGGEEGSMTMRWRHPAGEIQAALRLLDDDDKLLLKVSVRPEQALASYTVSLRCYPGSIQGGYKPDRLRRKREAVTPRRVLVRPEKEDNSGFLKAELTTDETWVLFLDRFFDVADNRGEGPCAVCFHPGEVSKASVSVENYSCYARFEYPGTQLDAHLVLWDLNGMTNAAAREYMQALEISVE